MTYINPEKTFFEKLDSLLASHGATKKEETFSKMQENDIKKFTEKIICPLFENIKLRISKFKNFKVDILSSKKNSDDNHTHYELQVYKTNILVFTFSVEFLLSNGSIYPRYRYFNKTNVYNEAHATNIGEFKGLEKIDELTQEILQEAFLEHFSTVLKEKKKE
jgi:hypothetical protein